MSFVYEGHPSTDETITAFSPTGGASNGGRTYIPVPFRSYLIECGIIPQKSSVLSTTTLQVKVSSVTGAAGTFNATPVISSTNSFTTAQLQIGSICSVSLAGTDLMLRGTVLEYTTSGGDSDTKGIVCYALVRRAESQ